MVRRRPQSGVPWRCPVCSPGDQAPIGYPIAGTRVYVLDTALQPCRVGEIGELYSAGPGLACGYPRGAALTAERSSPNLFAPEPGEQSIAAAISHRGARIVSCSFTATLIGRRKCVVFRIEPREIEVCSSGARHCASGRHRTRRYERRVAARCLSCIGRSVLAHLVLDWQGARQLDLGVLRRHLGSTLPEYMVRSGSTVLDALPLTANGKSIAARCRFRTAAGHRRLSGAGECGGDCALRAGG